MLDQYDIDQKVLTTLEGLPAQDSYIDDLYDAYRDDVPGIAVAKATLVLAMMVKYLCTALSYLWKNVVSRAPNSLLKNGNMALAGEGLTKSIEELDQTIHRQINLLRIALDQDRRLQEILDWFSKDDHSSTHTDISRRRLEGSASWFLELPAYEAWRDSDEVTTLWCPGLPGAGKTFTASAIIDDRVVNSDPSLVTCLYCHFEQRKEQNVEAFLSSIARQLVSQNRVLQKAASEFKNNHSRKSEKDLLQFLKDAIGKLGRTFVVIDALDEFSDDHDDRLMLIDALLELRAADKGFHVCITSREAPDIADHMEPLQQIKLRASEADIRDFVRDRISPIRRFQRWTSRDDGLLVRIQDAVLQKSDRM